ncbi:MAG TPA: DUF1223 domain-containing protein [Leeuwenhoekiella sp.]|nr:DUF1223 domain-containing protein [Leeuwenhoekiella sp.]
MKKPLFKTILVILTALGGISLISMGNSPVKTENNAVLIQLFTSQGCSSCPPADRLLNEIAKKYADDNVHVLSYHVDYWDRLGWKDTFSQKTYSEKQYAYAKIFNLNTVYTPQAIVNGATEFVGSNHTRMQDAIEDYTKLSEKAQISLQAQRNADYVAISYETTAMQTGDKLTFSLFIPEKNTAVVRGENKGKKLLSKNIVLLEKQTAQTQGKIAIHIPDTFKIENFGIMAYLQNEKKKVKAVAEEKHIKTDQL